MKAQLKKVCPITCLRLLVFHINVMKYGREFTNPTISINKKNYKIAVLSSEKMKVYFQKSRSNYSKKKSRVRKIPLNLQKNSSNVLFLYPRKTV